MSEQTIEDQELLTRVAGQLAKTTSATDHSMLTKWRVLSMCQYLFGVPERELGDACRAALEAFVAHGPGTACDKALDLARAVIKRSVGPAETVLPTISKEKRSAVSGNLDRLEKGGRKTIDRALQVLPKLRERMSTAVRVVALPGIEHRLELICAVLENSRRSDEDRARAGAAVLYIYEVGDLVPESLGILGMLDDDYALRIALEQIGGDQHRPFLHWSEKICSLWEDLPFLQGVNLHRGTNPISITWLDRVNSYLSYSYVLGSEKPMLVLLQPSTACSPLHAIVSLIGLLVLDALTSSETRAHALCVGQTYEVDGFRIRFEGIAGPPVEGWLRLRTRDGIIHQPAILAHQMVPVDGGRLSPAREFDSRSRFARADPMQRFFDWDTGIGPGSILKHLLLVTSRQRALDLLEGVQSNGVRLLDHGLVRFVGAMPDKIETHGTLLLVVLSLSVARILLDGGVPVQAILVDGYERLHRGRHELPFLINRQGAPPVISWSATGYYPSIPPTWLPPHKRLEVSSDDLASILEIEDTSTDIDHSSLWEAATGRRVQTHVIPPTSGEIAILQALDSYLQLVRSCQDLPEYWNYHLTTLARTLRVIVAATPAEWLGIRSFAEAWSASIDEKWTTLRPAAIAALRSLRNAESGVVKLIRGVSESVNSRAAGLAAFISTSTYREEQCYFVCDRPEQEKLAANFFRACGLCRVEAVLLRDLSVCTNCLVAGWVDTTFARRLWAHTPRAVHAFVDEQDGHRWERAADIQRNPNGQSVLEAVAGPQPLTDFHAAAGAPSPAEATAYEDQHFDQESGWGSDERVLCAFLWVTAEPNAKVLARDSRVVVEDGDVVRERVAARLRPDDRVILGLGTSRWSPSDEFTSAVVEAVQTSHPELVKTAREWRRALRQVRDTHQLSTMQLRARLASVSVYREAQTIEGWLDVSRASPIAPKGQRTELGALWPLIQRYTTCSLEDVAVACARLRALRVASGRALLQLWKGRTVELADEEVWLHDLVDRLRSEVQVYEIEALTLGEVPVAMLGWWITPAQASRFESESGLENPTLEDVGEEEIELT